MSSLIVEVCQIDSVTKHPNADQLEIISVKGWQLISQLGLWHVGDKAVYVPIESIIPLELSDKMNITNYLQNGRVKCVKLRGEPSFGVLIPAQHEWEVGKDVAEILGITKYEPPVRTIKFKGQPIDSLPSNSKFPNYTDIENLRNFNDVFIDGEKVEFTEKLHGANVKLGKIDGQLMAGSRKFIWKMPEELPDWDDNWYWYPHLIHGIQELFKNNNGQDIIIYGETYGRVQYLNYNIPGKLAFAAFDIKIDGKWVSRDRFNTLCDSYNIPKVPVIYLGPYSLEQAKLYSKGLTVQGNNSHIREGIVIRPIEERKNGYGRCIYKMVNEDYLLKRDAKELDTSDA
jgi:RNA ligase (TIGR02306 family)